MKALFAIFVSTLFSPILVAQTNQQPKPESTLTPSISPKQIADLPLPKRNSYRPSLTLQKALKIAEGYIRTERIDISHTICSRPSTYCTEAKTIRIHLGLSGGQWERGDWRLR